MNNNFTQLMTAEGSALTVEQRAFKTTHERIMSCGNMAGMYFVELAKELKRMRDEKLYEAAGFAEFGSYVEEAVGIKQRQAYNYIKVAEEYSEKYLAENAGLGVTKLVLLSAVTEEEREEISETIDVKKASTKKVEEEVKKALRERDEKQRALERCESELEDLREEVEQANAAHESIQSAYDEKKKELLSAKETVAKLKAQKEELEKKLQDAKPAEKEVQIVKDEAAEKEAEEQRRRAAELEQKLQETEAQLAAAKAQKKTIASDSLLIFKVKFESIQRAWSELAELVQGMDEDFAVKCKNALNATLDSWKGGLDA